jgi:electron-transferring-flavoprotein dehydrogenase
MGVDIFPGTAGSSVLYDHEGRVSGIRTGDLGMNKKGE